MTELTFSPANATRPSVARRPRLWLAELRLREPRLAAYGALLLALLLPLAIAWSLDDRTLRGANVWIKPIKFALSIALLSHTTAWFSGTCRPRAATAARWTGSCGC